MALLLSSNGLESTQTKVPMLFQRPLGTGRAGIVAALDGIYPLTDIAPLLLVVLPRKDGKTFAHVKWWGDCHSGVPTICVTRDALVGTKEKNGNVDGSELNLNFAGNLR